MRPRHGHIQTPFLHISSGISSSHTRIMHRPPKSLPTVTIQLEKCSYAKRVFHDPHHPISAFNTPSHSHSISHCQPISHRAGRMRARWLVLAALPLVAILLLLFSFSRISSNTFQALSYNDAAVVPKPAFTLLIGILTRADYHQHRHFLRLIYGTQPCPAAEIDVMFVFCNLTKTEQRMLIALEILRYNDIIVLNCSENMNAGKTYTYFSSLPRILPKKYDYVMKADDDVYIRLAPLAASLGRLEREDLYYGFVIPCASQNPFVEYMSGMGFVLSWDLVEWISESEIAANDTVGPEDKVVGRWLKAGKKGRRRYTEKPAMYDYPGTNGRCSHDLIPETVAVHRLKQWDKWLHALTFFNATQALRPSPLYHFD